MLRQYVDRPKRSGQHGGSAMALEEECVDARLKEGAARATVQKELACLGRMFRLGFQGSKISKVPYFPTITVDNARQGFLEYEAFEAVRRALPAHLRPLVTVHIGPAGVARSCFVSNGAKLIWLRGKRA